MIVKQTKTKEEADRCIEWLKENGDAPATNDFIYLEENGELKAVAGLENKFSFEPCHSLNPVYTQRLFDYALGVARTLGYWKIHFFTKNEKVVNILTHKAGGKVWSDGVTEVIVEL